MPQDRRFHPNSPPLENTHTVSFLSPNNFVVRCHCLSQADVLACSLLHHMQSHEVLDASQESEK